MKKLTLLFTVLSMFLLSSCRDIINSVLDAIPPFDAPFSATVTVPFAAVSSTNYTTTPAIDMNIDLDQKIKEISPSQSINNIKSVKMNTLEMLYVSSQAGAKLDAIKNARIYLRAPNQPDVLIATAYNNTNSDIITFTVVDQELLPYFQTTQNSLIVEIMASAPTMDFITLTMNSSFKAKVQL